jgi:Xaa-Pro aminopeptidase
MVITIEPEVITQAGRFNVEQNVWITSDGCEVLSSAPWELFVI